MKVIRSRFARMSSPTNWRQSRRSRVRLVWCCGETSGSSPVAPTLCERCCEMKVIRSRFARMSSPTNWRQSRRSRVRLVWCCGETSGSSPVAPTRRYLHGLGGFRRFRGVRSGVGVANCIDNRPRPDARTSDGEVTAVSSGTVGGCLFRRGATRGPDTCGPAAAVGGLARCVWSPMESGSTGVWPRARRRRVR